MHKPLQSGVDFTIHKMVVLWSLSLSFIFSLHCYLLQLDFCKTEFVLTEEEVLKKKFKRFIYQHGS